ncbi:MAG: HlyD family secretion protein, partial [Anaerolineae bacterium]
MTDPLTASGTIRASEVRIASEMGGRIGEVLVRTGDQVEAGDVVVSMDVTPLLLQLGPAEAAVETARADLALVRAGPRSEAVEATRAALALAEARRDGAKAAWENALEAVENPQELDAQIIEARTQVALAAQGVEKAESDLEAARAVRDRNFGSYEAEQRVKAAEAALSAAQADQATAQTALSHLLRIRQEPLGFIAQAHVAEGQYRVAEEEVAVARAGLDDLRAGPLPEEVAVAEAQVQQAEAEADVLRVQVAKGSLTTPIDGVVLEVVLRSGEIAAPAATILT